MSIAETTSALASDLRAEGFTGRLVEPSDAGYDAARTGFNAAIDRRPAAVALAADAGAEALSRALRRAAVPVLGRVSADRVLLDARTLLPGDESDVEAAVAALRFD
jgi:hypothetical protein